MSQRTRTRAGRVGVEAGLARTGTFLLASIHLSVILSSRDLARDTQFNQLNNQGTCRLVVCACACCISGLAVPWQSPGSEALLVREIVSDFFHSLLRNRVDRMDGHDPITLLEDLHLVHIRAHVPPVCLAVLHWNASPLMLGRTQARKDITRVVWIRAPVEPSGQSLSQHLKA